MRDRPAGILFALLPALLASAAGAQSIAFEPEMPTAGDEIEITVAAILEACVDGITSVEIDEGVVSVAASRGCVCLLAPPPFLQSFSTTVGPLDPGIYRVDFLITVIGCDPAEPPPEILLASATLAVAPISYEITLEPATPTTDDEVTLIVRSACPALFQPPEIAGVLVLLLQLPDLLAAPCFSDPEYENRFALGPVAAGEYAVLLLRDHEDGPPTLLLTAGFEVARAPSSQLLLLGGRFRVTADWNLSDGSGSARALPLTDDSGAMWFFDPANLELLIKVLEGCFWNDSFWVYAAGLTDVGVTLRVEDTHTGEVRTYSSSRGMPFETILDLGSFPCAISDPAP